MGYHLKRHLSVFGRVTIANTLLASASAYLAAFICPTLDQRAQLDKAIFRMVWGKSEASHPNMMATVNRQTAKRPKQEGGLGVISATDMIEAFQVKMVSRALDHRGAKWVRFF